MKAPPAVAPLSLVLNLLLLGLVVWLAVPASQPGAVQANESVPPLEGRVQLFTFEYHLYPDVEPSARNNYDEAFFPISDLEARPYVPSGAGNNAMTATGACIIIQTHIQLPVQSRDDFYNSSYEDVTCDEDPYLNPITATDYLGTRIAVAFGSDGIHAQVAGDAYILPYTAGTQNSFPTFRGSMPLMYAVPERVEGGITHGDLRYDIVPFEGDIVLTHRGTVEWQNGSFA